MSILKANRIENLTTTDGGINVNNSGNVKIGTGSDRYDELTASTANLQVDGGIVFEPGSGNDAEIINYRGTPMVFGTSGSERLRIDGSGNVGIGLTSPTEFVDIRKDQNAFTWAQIQNQNSSSGAYAGIQLGANGNTWGLANGSSAANSNSLVFVLDAGGSNSEKMRIDSSGNVGIGATSINNSYGTNVNIHTTTTNGARLKISDGTSGNGNVDGLDLIHQSGVAYIIQRENNSMRFSTNNTERMRIHAGGTVSVPVGIELGSGVDGTSANTLEDYEEGTFTPAFSFSNLSVSSYHTQQGSYIKVGHIVHVNVYVRFSGSNLSGTPSTSGAVYINLPFVAGTKYSDTQYLGEPAAIGRLAEFRGSNDSTDFDRIFHYIGNSSSSMYFAVNKQPASPQNTDFLYGMSEKSFNGLIGVANNFEYRHSFTYESSS